MGALAGYLRTYVAPPRYPRAQRRTLETADGLRLSAAHLPGPDDSDLAVVLVHGFVNWSRSPRVHAFAGLLSARAEVVVPDLRGHGRSEGGCTFGVGEVLDVAASVAALAPGRRVVTIGASLGAAAVLLHAADTNTVDTAVAVSSPAWWGRSDRPGAERVRRWTASPAGRAVLATMLRTRLEVGCPSAPHPVDRAGDITPARVVIVHDPADTFFAPEHAQALYEACNEPKQLWWMLGGHGTDLFTPELAGRVLEVVSRPPH